jgi:hypothetical protein
MRLGVLYQSGHVEEKPSVYVAMYSFLNGKTFGEEYGESFSPVRLVFFNEETNLWEKFVPSGEEIQHCMRAATAWIQQKELEKRWRE